MVLMAGQATLSARDLATKATERSIGTICAASRELSDQVGLWMYSMVPLQRLSTANLTRRAFLRISQNRSESENSCRAGDSREDAGGVCMSQKVWKPRYNWIVILCAVLHTALTRLERVVSKGEYYWWSRLGVLGLSLYLSALIWHRHHKRKWLPLQPFRSISPPVLYRNLKRRFGNDGAKQRH